MNPRSPVSIVLATPYAQAFDATRLFGALTCPDGLEWHTEFRGNALRSDTLIHISCNAHFTLFLPWIMQQILARIGEPSVNVGGPESCCGTMHRNLSDFELEQEARRKALHGFARARPRSVVTVCPDCDDTFNSKPIGPSTFRYMNFSELLVERLEDIRPHLRGLKCKVVVHEHDSSEERRADARRIRQLMEAIPGLTVLPSTQSLGIGAHCHRYGPMPAEKREAMFADARALGADTLVVPYHSCYRQHCGRTASAPDEPSHDIDVQHPLGLLAQSMGIDYDEPYKQMRRAGSLEDACAMVAAKADAIGLATSDLKLLLEMNVRR